MLLFLTLLGCPTPDATGDTNSASESTCPAGVLGEQDVGCTCGADTLEEYYGCEIAACEDDVLLIDDSDCCKAVDCE
jgi:hypothetical protein